SGAAFLISKPFSPETLEQALNVALRGGTAHTLDQVQVEDKAVGTGLHLPTPDSVAAVLRSLTNQKVSAIEWRTGPDPRTVAALGVYRQGEERVRLLWCEGADGMGKGGWSARKARSAGTVVAPGSSAAGGSVAGFDEARSAGTSPGSSRTSCAGAPRL